MASAPVTNVTETVEVRQRMPADECECDRFVLSAASGTLFHLSAWSRVVEQYLGHRSLCFVARRAGLVSGVLPVSWIKNKIFGDCLVSLPLAVYGGICADGTESWASLLKAGQDFAERLGVKYLELRHRTELLDTVLPGRDLYVTFTQDLRPGSDKLMRGLPRDTRYAIRKSQKAGLQWETDFSLDEFYNIYARSVHRLGTPVFSKRLFVSLQREFGDKCKIFGVRKHGAPIAAVMCLYFRDQVLPYYGGALPEYYKDAPNNFMYWSLIEQSCREGFQEFDFGRSKRGTGSFHFKSSWSMQVTPLPYRYHLVRAKTVPELSPVDRKFELAVAAWKRLPFSWSKVLGPRVIRWVPSV